ncbi:MAG: hypothetical protein OEW32_16490, partial [Nitrospira sp.]|nr:hypothetical protein [Nitrospira sp.]
PDLSSAGSASTTSSICTSMIEWTASGCSQLLSLERLVDAAWLGLTKSMGQNQMEPQVSNP